MIRQRSIGTDLAALTVVTLLPLLALGAYLSYRNVQDERAAIQATALRQARETAQRADELILDTHFLLTGLARTPTLREGDATQSRALLQEVKRSFPYYDDLFVVNAAGVVSASAAGPSGEDADVAGQSYFQHGIRDNGAVISDVLFSRTTGRPVVVIGEPIRAGDGGQAIGILAAALDLIRLQEWLDNRELLPGTTITVVDNQQGRVLARSLDPEAWIGRTLADVPVVRAAIEQDEGIVEGANVDGIARLNGFATAQRVPWSVLVGIPRDAVFAPLAAEIRLTLVRLGLVILATVALALVVGRRIVRPLQALTMGAGLIAGGNLAHRIAVRGRTGDEVAQLGGAMNRMADELVGSIEAHRRAQERLEAAVTQVGRALTSAIEPIALLTPLVEASVALARADAGLLAFRDGTPPITAGDGTGGAPSLLATLAPRCARAADATDGAASEALAALGMRECLTVAVRARDEELGTLLVMRRAAVPFDPADERLLRAFADQAAVAIEQAHLRTRVAQAEAVRELHRLQTDFLTTASHELRAPIAGIKSYAEVLLRDDLRLDAATRRDCLTGINRLADRLAAQVRAFFDAMRAGEGRFVLRREPVDLEGAAAAVVQSFAAHAPGHRFRLTVAPELPPALADPERVEDVFTNLLDNAVKYSPDGGLVEVTINVEHGVRDDDGKEPMLLVAVGDEGIGVPPEERERIFERFYRLDRLIARHAGGAGLGLFLCRAYVGAMGGRIWVAGRPGGGSSFRFTLPAAPLSRAGGAARPAGRDPEVAAR
ncbi:MAG: hypothetical protein AVDCRST_MAG88-73 [uncultured Thermomicrobiales bacterium]|uniref:histidine kinase n=1 Tax=uncultured Thermomicrobiales bacterium TaxID=1645740 RepID=A0A6J4U9M1_9BACT|nr:MAG: hypothetical protein AVDCRST_MAG88-73 [uncultured Thermomicrobiales bacterium]